MKGDRKKSGTGLNDQQDFDTMINSKIKRNWKISFNKIYNIAFSTSFYPTTWQLLKTFTHFIYCCMITVFIILSISVFIALVNSFSWPCVFRCLFRLLDWLNLRSQRWHSKGFSPVWTRKWVFKLFFWLNDFPQTVQEYGFSPVWVRTWVFKLLLWMNFFPQ